MECKFMRVKSFLEDEDLQAPEDLLKLRFVRNLKYCDLFARNEQECREWLEAFGKVMIRTDFHQRYKVKKQLGEGSFAKVYLAQRLDDSGLFAIKAFSKEGLCMQNKGKHAFVSEVEILSDLDHENLMKLYEVHESKNSLYLVCEYLNGGSLNDYLRNLEDYLTSDQILNVIMYHHFMQGHPSRP